jgi:hypothetical protein
MACSGTALALLYLPSLGYNRGRSVNLNRLAVAVFSCCPGRTSSLQLVVVHCLPSLCVCGLNNVFKSSVL